MHVWNQSLFKNNKNSTCISILGMGGPRKGVQAWYTHHHKVLSLHKHYGCLIGEAIILDDAGRGQAAGYSELVRLTTLWTRGPRKPCS